MDIQVLTDKQKVTLTYCMQTQDTVLTSGFYIVS